MARWRFPGDARVAGTSSRSHSQSAIDDELDREPADASASHQINLFTVEVASIQRGVARSPGFTASSGPQGTGSLVSPCMEHTQCSCPRGVRSVKPCTTTAYDVRNPLLQPVVICHLFAGVPNQRRLNSHYPAESEMLYGCAPPMDVLNGTCRMRFLQHLRCETGVGDERVSKAAHFKVGSSWVSHLCSTSRFRRSAVTKY